MLVFCAICCYLYCEGTFNEVCVLSIYDSFRRGATVAVDDCRRKEFIAGNSSSVSSDLATRG